MLDFRYYTFIALSKIKNYTKTAEFLHITQPAVSQHIKFLENKYNCKLFYYENKKLELTEEGQLLREFIIRIEADSKHFNMNLKDIHTSTDLIIFGATKSVGEYIMPNILTKLIKNNPRLNIHMEVNNTQVLLEKLWKGEINFAIVEGIFDKSKYHSILFSQEKFIPICAPNSKFANREVKFSELLNSPLVIREKGSGTREIFENILKQYNYTLDSFDSIIEIGNMSAIKDLVTYNIGITFLYEVVAQKELMEEKLSKMKITGFEIQREFNFVFLKDSFYKDKYLSYFNLMKDAYI